MCIISPFPRRLAAFAPEEAETSRQLKRFLYEKVYAAPALVEERARSLAMIGKLFQFFLERPHRLPQPYSEQANHTPAHRVVCDYIAGMTDGFFRRTYEQTIAADATLRAT